MALEAFVNIGTAYKPPVIAGASFLCLWFEWGPGGRY